MRFADQAIGGVLILSSIVIFAYYTFWVFFIPFLDDNSVLQQWFLPQHYAIAIPATLLMAGMCGISVFISIVYAKEAAKKKKN
mmetsp:Transcript_24216/g.41122  ORF Transcript_24216/g.41122 Transcript_24216/m.41122 type:complete len:83 (-) Transcript_24216:111-359(-)